MPLPLPIIDSEVWRVAGDPGFFMGGGQMLHKVDRASEENNKSARD